MFNAVDSWARLVRTGDEVPEAFRDKFNEITKKTAGFPYTVFAPPDRWGRRRANSKLLSLVDTKLLVFEKIKKEIRVTGYCYNDIYRLERGKCLLYSWLRINATKGQTTAGETIEYNTVVEKIFSPVINRIRREISSCDTTSLVCPDSEQTKFDYLNFINYKFMNFGRQSILPGEKVTRIVYQPEIKEQLFRRFWKYLSPSQIIILTDKELIVIKESDKNRHFSYGGIWNYIPLNRVSKITCNENGKGNLNEATIHLSNQEQFYFKYSPVQQNVWDLLRDDIDNGAGI